MANKCPKLPPKVKKAFKDGASEVKECGPRYDGDFRIIRRKGREMCKIYRKKGLLKRMF